MKKWVHIILWVSIGCFIIHFFGTGAIAGTNIHHETENILVTATFFDTDLREALKEVSLQTGVTIITDENIKGVITMELKDVPFEKALRMMISGGGYMYRKFDDYYIVGLPDAKNPTYALLCQTEIFRFKNISAESAKALLPEIYREYVRFDVESNVATVNAPSSIVTTILADLAKMDEGKAQIRIKALVTEVQTDAIKELGLNLLEFNNEAGVSSRAGSYDMAEGLMTLRGSGSFGQLLAKIKLLSQEKKAAIQADPVILIAEGKTGQLFVGDKKTIILRPDEDSPYSNQSETVEAGITLKVTPRVYHDFLELFISQKVSGIEEEEVDRILIKTREFESVVRLAPGQTMMVGGLTLSKEKSDQKKVPGLGDVPLIRFFFREKITEKSDSQLLIFITAEVVKE
ncbi:MAG TPA: hypothetical protein PLC07_04185 [Bacillota bacterium]|nr:hypothetical protein [Bacillota bacterium]HPT88615.1 hypothetical protein [Bacillota bacterium]